MMKFTNPEGVQAICEELTQEGRLAERMAELEVDAQNGKVHVVNAKQWLASLTDEKSQDIKEEENSATPIQSAEEIEVLDEVEEELANEVDAEREELIQSLNNMTVAQLKDHLRARKLKLGGAKAELIQRLENHILTDADAV